MNRAKAGLLARMGWRLLAGGQFRRLGNYGLYRLLVPLVSRWGPDRLVFRPPNVVIAVTARCNKACDFCYFRGELDGDDAGRLELRHDVFVAMLAHPTVRHALRIALTGGEPLLNADIFRMVAEARRRGFIVTVVTNGRLLEARGPELAKAPPDLLSVSYDPAQHDELAAVLPRLVGRVALKLNFVLSRDRMAHLPDCFRLAVSTGVGMVDIEHVVVPAGRADPADPAVERDDPEFRAILKRVRDEFGATVPASWGPFPGDRPRRVPSRCRVFWHSLHLDGLGRITPCCQWPLATYQGSLFQVEPGWNAPFLRAFRRAMRRGELPAPCARCALVHEDYLGI